MQIKGGKVFEEGLVFAPGKSRKNIMQPLKKHLKEIKYDVVHVHSGSVSVLAYVAKVARNCGVNQIIVHSHSPAEHETIKHILAKLATRHIMETCPTMYFACSLNAAEWKFPMNIVKSNVYIIKNGIDLDKYIFTDKMYKKIRKDLGIPDDSFVIGHVGRFSPEKNHEFILKFFSAFKKLHENAKLVLVGDGELFNSVKEIVDKKRLSNDVLFLGNISNVNEVMQAMDVFILPSLYEGLPLVGVEAQAAGLPLFVSNNVSKELKLTNSITFLPIENVDKWVKEVSKVVNKPRYENKHLLKEKGFDIAETTSIICKIYKSGEK